MYKTFSAIILNRFEAFNNRLLTQISNTKSRTRLPAQISREGAGLLSPGAGGREEDDPMSGVGAAAAGTPAREGTPAPTGNPGQAQKAGGGAAGGAGAGAGGKKKKKGKK
jgi:hypothetical protein